MTPMTYKRLAAIALLAVTLPAMASQSLRAGDTFTVVVTTFKDGDSFAVTTLDQQRLEVRLWGIDAPEGRQSCADQRGAAYACGRDAGQYKRRLTEGKNLTCTVVTPADAYKRIIARCTVDGSDLGETLVRAGHAVDWPRYSRGHYDRAQSEARQAKRGVWQGTFQSPWDYRSAQRGK